MSERDGAGGRFVLEKGVKKERIFFILPWVIINVCTLSLSGQNPYLLVLSKNDKPVPQQTAPAIL